jgi:hypothetical protein
MNNKSQMPKDKTQDILEKIRRNELMLKPKIYFRLRFVAFLLVVFVVLVVSVFLSSLILFTIRASGQASLIGFGPAGWQVFLILFPWGLSTLEVGLIILLQYLLRSFKFGYKIPILYLLGGVLVIMLLSGFAIDKTPLHNILLRQADENHLPPPFGNLYEGARRLPPPGYGIFFGTLTGIKGNALIINLLNPMDSSTATIMTVILPPGQTTVEEKVGDRIIIQGKIIDGEIQAQDIKNVNNLPPPPIPQKM